MSGSKPELSPRSRIGVIIDENRHSDALRQTIAQRLITPCQMRGKPHERLLSVYPAGCPDAYSTDRKVTSQFTDRLNDSVLNSLGAARGCQALNTPNNLATFIYDTSGDLRAANIYANAKQ
ncbi:hypothetical protein HMPREF9582_00837 [Cutibacterium acnes HL060PA1]|nr:hypothetical protein HMPREF9582_00837 [Cutibacterium acnes HL060PA1]EFT79015.1 hypothetical protein HMPREF9601_00663 [Cutibacterium acnes HL030PA1]